MAGVQITVALNDTRAREALRDIEAGLVDTLPLMDALGAVLVEGTVRRFESGIGPDGVAWKPSFRSQIQGGPTLIDSARLVSSITHTPSQDEVRVGTNVPYALIHQLGGDIVPVNAGALTFQLANGATVSVGKVTMPARPFLGFDLEDIAGIEDEIEAFVEELLE